MSASFVTQLRVSRPPLVVGEPGRPAIRLRVQVPEVWDLVRIDVPAGQPVRTIKLLALEVLRPGEEQPAEYVMKLGGWEILDEQASLGEVGAVDGSTFLLTSRRRRPVR
ncbi:MAG TPA: hypothetical protein VMM18_18465 [Gemmatimonadaceae bacterium]|nr:hypothetical protein [Gemmatimonadaceae bacterium]